MLRNIFNVRYKIDKNSIAFFSLLILLDKLIIIPFVIVIVIEKNVFLSIVFATSNVGSCTPQVCIVPLNIAIKTTAL